MQLRAPGDVLSDVHPIDGPRHGAVDDRSTRCHLPRFRLFMPDDPCPALTIYFDGACPVCTREIALYRRQPGAQACEWVDVSSCPDTALGPDLTREAALARFHVRRADGELVDGMRGFATLWRTLPRTAWLGRLASAGPVPVLLDGAYAAFLSVRRLWRRPPDTALRAADAARPTAACAPAATAPWPAAVEADLRSDHAGEVGAVAIYRGVLAVSRDPALRAFAAHHLRTERVHLEIVSAHCRDDCRSRLVPAWKVAGWLTGALPALFGPSVVYATIAAVETFVDRHYAEQIERLDAMPDATRWAALRADLERCRLDEVAHRDEARAAGPADGTLVRLWIAMVGRGSAAALAMARRV
jgi:3-demethoxyubiquinol 3-hydroxylase